MNLDECQTSCLYASADCQVSSFLTDGPNTDSCRCDRHCSFFQDCCQELPPPPPDSCANQTHYSGTDAELWACQSLYPTTAGVREFSSGQAGVYAVSQCPSTWISLSQQLGLSLLEFALVQEACGADIISSDLPLVSDVALGRVFRNEFCALCHGVSQMSLWHRAFLCSADLLLTSAQSQLSPEAISMGCSSCSYWSPPLLYFDRGRDYLEPRSCTPAISSCPSFSDLSGLDFDPTLSAEDYQDIVDGCAGATCYIRAFSSAQASEVIYKNQFCAACNNLSSVLNLTCLDHDKPSFPACEATTTSNLTVEIVIDAVSGDTQVFRGSDIALLNTTIDLGCSFGYVFDFVNLTCRKAVCSLFESPNSSLPCDVLGFPTDQATTPSPPACSQVLVLENELLFIPLNSTTVYYISLLSIIFVSHFDQLGQPVACLDRVVPFDLPYLKVLRRFNVLVFVVVGLSVLVLGFVAFLHTIPGSMRSVFGTVVASFVTASLLGDLALILAYPGSFVSGSVQLCLAAGILDHLFGLSQCFWLCMHALDVGLRSYRVAKSLPARHRLSVLVLYLLVGWLVPSFLISMEVAIGFATDDMGGSFNCFRVGSFWNTLFLLVLPGAVAVIASVVAVVLFPVTALVSSYEPSRKEKCRFVLLSLLVALTSASFVARAVAGVAGVSRFAYLVLGFVRLVLVLATSCYAAATFAVLKKVPTALRKMCGCESKSSVRPATLEMSSRGRTSNRPLSVPYIPTTPIPRKELEEFAEFLENPWKSATRSIKEEETRYHF